MYAYTFPLAYDYNLILYTPISQTQQNTGEPLILPEIKGDGRLNGYLVEVGGFVSATRLHQ